MTGNIGQIPWPGLGITRIYLNDSSGFFIGQIDVKRTDSTSKIYLATVKGVDCMALGTIRRR